MRIASVPVLACLSLCVPAFAQQVQYFPQFADGEGYTTTWNFTGYGPGTTDVTVELFDRNGWPLTLQSDLGTSNRFVLSIQGYGSTSLRTSGTGSSLRTGWARVTSSLPVGATEVYRYERGSESTGAAAVFGSNPVVSATLFCEDPRATAIALLNTGASTVTVDFTLRNAAGLALATSSYTLSWNSQVSLFVHQLPGFGSLAVSRGSIELHASAPVHIVTLAFQDKQFAVTPVLPGRSNPQSARSTLLSLFDSSLQQTRSTADQLLPPAEEDIAAAADFLRQQGTGVIRLLPRETYEGLLSIRGGGAYYSFARLDHAYGYGSDIELQQGYLAGGFAGADYAFMTSLGDVPIESVTTETPAVQYLASYTPPTREPDARVEQQRSSAGFTAGTFQYQRRLRATVATTFALRSVCYRTSDLLVAFRLTRLDSDGSAILVWKVLKTYAVPQLTP